MNELRVTISGQVGTGKSIIAEVIRQALESRGFTIEFDDSFDGRIKSNLEHRISTLKDIPHKITIETVQTPRVKS